MLAKDFFDALQAIAPLAIQESWDHSGIQVAAECAEISKVCVALDPTLETVQKACAQHCDVLVTHHPLLLQPKYLEKCDSYFYVVKELLAANTWLYAAHTSLDANGAGPAGWLAREIPLHDVLPLEPNKMGPPFGLGSIGKLQKPLPANEVLTHIHALLGVRESTLIGKLPKTISTIAYCTGSGGSLISLAKEMGADLYITGDVKYHQALESPLCILDVGHHSLEEAMMFFFAHLLQETLPLLSITFLPSQNPYRLLTDVLQEETL